MRKEKIQPKSFVIAAGAAPTTTTITLDTDSGFDKVIGFCIVRPKGTEPIDVSIIDAGGNTIVEPVDATVIEADKSTPTEMKFFKGSPFPAGGKKIKMTVEHFAAPATEQRMQFVYLLGDPIK